MKKKPLFSFLLAVLLVIGCIPTVGAESMQETEETTAETQEIPHYETIIENPSELAFGSTCILQGCRTIDGNVPLAGSSRKVESAQGVFVYERSTGTVIYSYNADTRMSPGGLAKIVNAMVVLEHCPLDEVVTVSTRNFSKLILSGTQNQKLKEEEELTISDLLHCMIMAGANDAAVVLAEHVAGNHDAFVALMNQRVQQIGCTNTEFGNCHGLDNAVQYTTPRDMARIVQDATRNETFRKLFVETTYTVPETNRSGERTFESQNYLVDTKNIQKYYDSRVTGGMQAYSATSGAGVVFTAESKGIDIVCVLLGCTRQLYENGWSVKVYGNMDEAVDLLKYVYGNFKTSRVLYYGQALKQFTVPNGECSVTVEPHMDIDSVLPLDAQMKNLTMDYIVANTVAPISQGDLVATVKVYYIGTCLMEAELYAMNDVRPVSEAGMKVLGGANRTGGDSGLATAATIVSVIVLVPVVGYLTINSILRSRRRAQMRRRKHRRNL